MTETTSDFGMVAWDDVELQDAPQQNFVRARWDDIIKLSEGKNLLRLITKPHQYWIHKYKNHEDDPGYPDKIKCSKSLGSCPICDMKDKDGKLRFPRTRRWYIGVIDRRSQAYKVLDVSPTLFRQIREFTRDEAWGDPSQYDIVVKVTKSAPPSGYYTVIPQPKTALSPGDLEVKKMLKCAPSPAEWIAKRVLSLRSKSVNQNQSGGNGSSPASESEGASVSDEDLDFPAAEVE
jgi:hypothetical protein